MIKPTSMIRTIKHPKKFLFATAPRSRSTTGGAPCPLSPGNPHAVNWRKSFFSFWSCFLSWSQWPGHFLSRQFSISFFSPKQDAWTGSLVDLLIGSSTVLIGDGESSDRSWAMSSPSSNEPLAESFTNSSVSLWSRSPAKRSVEKLFESDEGVSPVEDALTCVIVVLFSDIFELSCEILVLFCGIEQFLVLSLIPKPQLWLQLLHWSHSVHAGGNNFLLYFTL